MCVCVRTSLNTTSQSSSSVATFHQQYQQQGRQNVTSKMKSSITDVPRALTEFPFAVVNGDCTKLSTGRRTPCELADDWLMAVSCFSLCSSELTRSITFSSSTATVFFRSAHGNVSLELHTLLPHCVVVQTGKLLEYEKMRTTTTTTTTTV